MINSFLTWFDSISKRERMILIITVTVAIIYSWDNFFYQPLQIQKKSLSIELLSLQSNIQEQEILASTITTKGNVDPNLVKQKKLAKIKLEIKSLKEQLEVGVKQFVPAENMAQALQQILNQNKNLTLIKLETLPVAALLDTPEQKPWLFKHALNITITGSYFETLDYLKSLESLAWHINWNSIDYQVDDYPLAITTFQIYTLSFEEQWLGL